MFFFCTIFSAAVGPQGPADPGSGGGAGGQDLSQIGSYPSSRRFSPAAVREPSSLSSRPHQRRGPLPPGVVKNGPAGGAGGDTPEAPRDGRAVEPRPGEVLSSPEPIPTLYHARPPFTKKTSRLADFAEVQIFFGGS